MGIFRNKFFLFGVLLLLAAAIPLTIYFVQRQQDLQQSAAPTSNLAFEPASQTVSVGDEFSVDVSVDPGQNFVSFVQVVTNYDSSILEVVSVEPNITNFPLTLEGPDIGNGTAAIAVGIGADVTQAIQTPTTVVTVNFRALAPTAGTPTQVTFGAANTQVLSLSIDDQPGENVLSNTSPANITVLDGDGGEPTPTPSVGPGTLTPTPTPTTPVGGQPTPTDAPTPTPIANQAPSCTNLSASPANSGVAPFAVNFTAEGNDPDGLIAKATFSFGDGDLQDVFDGLNAQQVTTQMSHTYQTPGTYNATVVFTDNSNSISQSCTQEIIVTSSGDTGTVTPTPTTAPGATAPTSTPIPTKPPIDAPGGLIQTIGIAGALIITVVGGALLLVL